MDILRIVETPPSAREMAKRAIVERALDASDRGLRSLVTKRVGMALPAPLGRFPA